MKLDARSIVAVFVGGLAGSAARLGFAAASAGLGVAEQPTTTLVINILGSFVLGAIVSGGRSAMPEWAFTGLSVGFLGAFTTLSAVSADVVTSVASGGLDIGVAYAATNLVFGVFAALVGLRAGRALSSGRS